VIVTIISLLFPPDMGGGATRAMNIAESLVQLGHEVRIITSIPHYPRGAPILKSLRARRQNIGEMKITRLPILGLPHKGFVNRFVIYSWFAFLSFLELGRCRGSSKIISIGPHPFTDISSYAIKIATKSSLLIDISDLWPETWVLDNRFANALFQGVGYCLNKIVLRHLVDGLSVYNERALDYLVNRYGFCKQHVVIYNSADTRKFTYDHETKVRKENLRTILGKDVNNRFVVLYHGVIGPYQRIETIIDAASIEERELGKALFIIVGEGEQKEKAIQRARNIGNRNVVFLPRMNRSEIQKIVAESDLGLVPIVSEQDLTLYVSMPLKATEFLASGTPVLVPKGSFIGKFVTRDQAGLEVDFSSPSNIFEAIKKVATDSEAYEQMARHARQVAVDHFSLDQINEVIRSIMTDHVLPLERTGD